MKIAYLMQEGGPDVRQKPLKGPANHVWHVFKILQEHGHHVRLLVRYNGQNLLSDNLETFVPVYSKGLDKGLRRWFERGVRGVQSRLHLPYANWFESIRFANIVRQEFGEYDLFYERMGWMGFGGGLAAHSLNKPLVLEANNGDFITELERLGVALKGIQRQLAIYLMKRAAHRCTHAVATGDGHRQRFIEWYGMSPSKVTTVENGSEIIELLGRDQLRSFQSLSDEVDEIKIVFVGAVDPWQGVPQLVSSMATVAAELPSVRLEIIGSGTEMENVINLVKEKGLSKQVVLTGQISIHQVAEHLSQADIGVAPYCGWMEYSGLKLFDYKSAGLAIIASGENRQPATIQHDQTGWIVPPCDEQALSEAIIMLATDCSLRRRLGQAARLEAESIHSWGHTVDQLEQLFDQILGSK